MRFITVLGALLLFLVPYADAEPWQDAQKALNSFRWDYMKYREMNPFDEDGNLQTENIMRYMDQKHPGWRGERKSRERPDYSGKRSSKKKGGSKVPGVNAPGCYKKGNRTVCMDRDGNRAVSIKGAGDTSSKGRKPVKISGGMTNEELLRRISNALCGGNCEKRQYTRKVEPWEEPMVFEPVFVTPRRIQ